jgi:hypothetical protein
MASEDYELTSEFPEQQRCIPFAFPAQEPHIRADGNENNRSNGDVSESSTLRKKKININIVFPFWKVPSLLAVISCIE